MTVFDYSGDSLDVGRALILACAAYESRTGHPPPLIKEPERIAGYADILGFQYKTADGKVFTTTAAEYKRMLLFARIFDFKPDKPSNGGKPDQGRHGRRRKRPPVRSMVEWEERNRSRDLRKLARAEPALRREILNTFDVCPCCNHRLKGEPP